MLSRKAVNRYVKISACTSTSEGKPVCPWCHGATMAYSHDQIYKCGKCGAESDFVGMFMRTMGTDEAETLTELNREECWEAFYDADGKKHYGNGLADLEREWREKEPVSDPSPVATPTPETVKKSILPKGAVAAGRDNARKPRTLEDFVSVFQKVTKIGEGKYKVLCPCHDDTKPSLSISLGNNGKILMHCFNDCDNQAILSAVGYTVDDFYLDKDYGQTGTTGNGEKWQRYVEGREHKKVEGIYHYHTTTGDYSFTRLRMEGKNFIYGILDNGRFTYGFGGRSRRDIPAVYCPDLADFRKAITDGQTVYYCEGEKDVNTLTRYGLHAITCGGTSDWNKECVSLFEDANVVILADNDVTGKKLGDRVRADVARVANTVKVVIPTPDIPKGDVSDYLTTHTVKELLTLVNGEEEKQAPSDPTPEAPKEPTPPTPPEAPKEPEAKQEPTPETETVNLDMFHVIDQGKITGVDDNSIFEYLREKEHIFFLGSKPYIYQNGVYVLDKTGAKLKTKVADLIYPRWRKAPTIKRVYDRFPMDSHLEVDYKDLNNFPKWWINFQNGFYDPVNKVLLPHSPNYKVINQIPHIFNPNAELKGTIVKEWLENICETPEDMEMLCEFSGYCMTQDTRQQKFLILVGEGGTGKSTIIRMIGRAVGTDNISNVSLEDLNNNRFSSFGLMGKLLNSCADLEIGALSNTSTLKKVLGEDDISGESKGKDAVSFFSYAKLLFSVNELPLVKAERTNGFYRRLMVLPIDKLPNKKDTSFFERISMDIDDFILLSVRALERMYERGTIAESERSKEAIKKLRCESDTVEAFLTDRTERVLDSTSNRIKKLDLFETYIRYCSVEERTPLTKNNFYKAMKVKGYADVRYCGADYFRGIRYQNIPRTSLEKSLRTSLGDSEPTLEEADVLFK